FQDQSGMAADADRGIDDRLSRLRVERIEDLRGQHGLVERRFHRDAKGGRPSLTHEEMRFLSWFRENRAGCRLSPLSPIRQQNYTLRRAGIKSEAGRMWLPA